MIEDLPVENVGDGEGTFIAGIPNPHLNLLDTIDCATARAYWVKAFIELDYKDRLGYLEAQNRLQLSLLSVNLLEQMTSYRGILIFIGAGVMAEDVLQAEDDIGDYLSDTFIQNMMRGM